MKKMISGLYIHIPFCTKRCHYCDFFSIKTSLFNHQDEQFDLFINALNAEIDLYKAKYSGNIFSTLYLGGGTPSLLSIKQLDKFFHKLLTSFQFKDQFEFTIEVNPESIDSHKLFCYKHWGVNRISLGCQTFSDSHLKLIGRNTTSQEIISKYNLIRRIGFNNVSFDFIFGLVNQSLSDYQNDIQLAVDMNPEHLSCYNLTLGGTLLTHKVDQGCFRLPDEELVRQEYLWGYDYLNSNGYKFYEVSNFAQQGKESQHNLGYWRQEDYLGLGPSACGTVNNERYNNVSSLKQYYHCIDKGSRPLGFSEILNDQKIRDERIMLALRLKEGLDMTQLEKDFDAKWFLLFITKKNGLVEQGFLSQHKNLIFPTTKGLLLLNQIIFHLL